MTDTRIIHRPMLAAAVEADQFYKIQWPILVSPKVDGIRCLIHPELGPVTRSFKPIPNHYIRGWLEGHLRGTHFDGELYAVHRDGTADFNATQSAVMSRDGRPHFRYAIFDQFLDPDKPFMQRYREAMTDVTINYSGSGYRDHIEFLFHVELHNEKELAMYTERCLNEGYEGVCIRHQGGPYKSGRSTLNQGWLLKWKPWADAEGTILRVEELYHNENEDIKDEFGLAKRTSHNAGKVAAGTMGALILDTEWGVLRVGTGFDHAMRDWFWRNKDVIVGRTVTFKFQRHGMQDLPRFPVFKGLREVE